MYKLPAVDLPIFDTDALQILQTEVDASGDYEARVATSKSRFATKPSALFKRVRDKLTEMSGDLVRCAYCEDSCADEVEHLRPKDFFPEDVFRWPNYLFSCGPCNGGKRNKYPVLVSGVETDLVAHRELKGVILPPQGVDLFINPRLEEPLDFLWLDLTENTFMLSPLDDEDVLIRSRANVTIDILRLNREMLRKARANAYAGYRDRLAQLVTRIGEGAPLNEIENRAADISRSPHRTVWLEMKRQRNLIVEIKSLFESTPSTLLL